jgi:hypothetical protein
MIMEILEFARLKKEFAEEHAAHEASDRARLAAGIDDDPRRPLSFLQALYGHIDAGQEAHKHDRSS